VTRVRKEVRSMTDEVKNSETQEVDARPVRETAAYSPRVDIYEGDKAVVVEADMPGVDRTGVEVQIDKGLLTIGGRTRRKPEDTGVRLVEEFRPVDYYRAFQLGEGIDEGNIGAVMTDGVLTVTLPFTQGRGTRKIEVK
jgi:HSP20 family protein